jgi:hypothetical protein
MSKKLQTKTIQIFNIVILILCNVIIFSTKEATVVVLTIIIGFCVFVVNRLVTKIK